MTATPEPTSSGTVAWGILATGRIARSFARDLVAHGHRITAVGSRSFEKAQDFAEEFGIPTFYGSYDELVDDPNTDVIYVATPHSLHAANAKAALTHGKHVLLEKPFTINATEAREVADHADESGLLVMEAMWTRFLPHMRFLREVVAAGRIGEVRSLHADHTQQLTNDPDHRLNNLKLGGGALLDLGVYPLSFAHDLLGPPSDVIARGILKPTGTDASVATILQHVNGAMSTSYSSMETRGTNTATVLGSSGRIEVSPIWYAPAAVAVYDADGRLVDRFEKPVSGKGRQYQALEVERLIEARETASPLMTPAESIAVMTTLDQIRAAIGVRYPSE